jgi:hypothetical protein
VVPEDEQAKTLLRLLQPAEHLCALRDAMYAAPDLAPAAGRDGQLVDRRPSGARKLVRLLYEILAEERQGGRGPGAAQGGHAAWHPGMEDEDWDPEWHRLHRLLCAYNVAGRRDPSRQQGVTSRLLKAYREGYLGRHTWDTAQELEGCP